MPSKAGTAVKPQAGVFLTPAHSFKNENLSAGQGPVPIMETGLFACWCGRKIQQRVSGAELVAECPESVPCR